MFICEITGKQSRAKRLERVAVGEEWKEIPAEKPTLIVAATRAVQYKHWDHENEEHWYTNGTEIVRELRASEEGARLWNSWTDEQRAAFLKS